MVVVDSSKSEERELTRLLYLMREEQGLVLMRRLIKVRLEQAKEGLVVCPPAEIDGLRGVARALLTLETIFTKAPIEIPQAKV